MCDCGEPSGGPAPEERAAVARCAVANGSLAVFDAEGLAKLWEDEATALRMNYARGANWGSTASSRVYAQATQLEKCAKELRQWVALPSNRQPQENKSSEPQAR